jgi:hypothetical protein
MLRPQQPNVLGKGAKVLHFEGFEDSPWRLVDNRGEKTIEFSSRFAHEHRANRSVSMFGQHPEAL